MNKRVFESSGIVRFEGVTDSGLPVYVFPRPGFQSQYAFFATHYGGGDRRFLLDGRMTDTPAGIAHYLEHKMFDMPDHNAMDVFAALGSEANAFTSNDTTGYLFQSSDRFLENLRELLSYVTTPYFTEKSVAKEQGIIGQEIRMGEDDPSHRVWQNQMRALYARHPVRESIAGTVDSIAKITPELLYDCHRMFYRPDNMVLCCAGSVDPEAILDLANEMVSGPKGPAPERDYGGEDTLLPASIRLEERMAVSMPLFYLGAKLRFRESGNDWAKELLKADLACTLLLGDSAPLYNRLYEEGLINQSFYAGSYDFQQGGVCYASGRCAKPVELLGRIVDAAEAFRMDEETLARFRRQRKTTLGNFLMELDNLTELCHSQAEGHFNGWERMHFPELCMEITPAEVEAFVRETFSAERLALSVISPL